MSLTLNDCGTDRAARIGKSWNVKMMRKTYEQQYAQIMEFRAQTSVSPNMWKVDEEH